MSAGKAGMGRHGFCALGIEQQLLGVHAQSLQSCLTLCNPMGCSPPRFLCPWVFSRKEYRSGLPCPPPEDLPIPGIEPRSSILQAHTLPYELPGKPWIG